MKKLKLLFTALFVLCSLTASAHDFEVDGIYYNILPEEDKTVEVTYRGDYYDSYNNEYTGSVVIPESVTYSGATYSVTSIGNYAFYNCTGLKSIKIPNSVTSIGEWAFDGTAWYDNKPNGVVYAGKVLYGYKGTMPEKTSITIKDGTLGIAGAAFINCSGLTNVVIPNSVTSIGSHASAYYEGCGAFEGCTGLTSITIPNSVTSIRDDAFSGCTGLKSITIPNSVTSIGSSAFSGCTGLTNITIPNSVTNIGEWAFIGCDGLTSIEIPNSVKSIGWSAFSYCSGLTSIVVDGNNTKYDSRENCNAIIETETNTLILGCKNTIIPNSVTSIEGRAFSGCTGLKSITIPNSVTSIRDDAFSGCTGLKSITIPNSVTSIEWNTFEGCTGLKTVYNFSNLTFSKGSEDDGYVAHYADRVYNVPNGSIEGDFIFGKPNDVNTLLYYLGNATELTLPADYNDENYTIGADVFNGNTTITSIIIPNSVTSIGKSAFYNCKGLKTVYNFSNLTFSKTSSDYGYVSYYADKVYNLPEGFIENDFVLGKVNGVNTLIAYLGNATELTLPADYKGENYVIGASVFKGNTTITSIEIPNSITSIGEWGAFNGCTGLKSINVESGNTIYDSRENCNAIIETETNTLVLGCKNTIIPNSVTSIGEDAFNGCTGLTSITIPNSVTSIGWNAFSDCYNLKSITIPNSITSIESSAFEGTAWYNNQPNGVVYAGKVLYGYKGTMPENTSITIKDGTSKIADGAFYGNIVLTSIAIPNSVTSIGSYAFLNCTGLTSITIPNSVTSIGYAAFASCTGLTSVEIPNSVTSIGGDAFNGCSGLTSITIPNSVTSIGEYAFNGCSGLTSITIPNSVTSIGEYAFAYCTGLTSITIPNSVTSIGDWAFLDCTDLTSIVIPNSVTSIGYDAFEGCTELKTVYNLSNLTFSTGSSSNGYVAYYADRVYNVPNGSIEGDFIFGKPNGVNTLVGYLGNATELILPADYKGEDYVIGADAFKGNTTITSVTIPNSVTSIGYGAFNECTSLKELRIEDGESTLSLGYNTYEYYNTGKGLFYDCPLETLYLGRDLSYNTDYDYGYSPFYNKTTLRSVTIGNSVTSIEDYAFSGCSGLTSITIPNSVTSIGDRAFYSCKGLKKAIWLTNTPPSGYKNVGATYNYVANNEYSGLSNVKVYSYLSSIFEVDGVKYVPVSPAERTCDAIDCAYNDTTSVDIVIGKTVSYKGISMNVKEIMPYALYSNKKIKSVKFENEGNIGDYAFCGCTALTTADISNEGGIGAKAFSDCRYLIEATLGESVMSIGTEAFSNCTALGNIVIPDAVTSLGSKAFSGCSALKSTEIGAGVTTINEATFSGCSAMTSITIGGSVKTIGENAFYGCSALAEISIPQSVTKIADYVFDNCSSLTDVIIENNSTVLSLGSNGASPLFADCPLDSMYIGRKISYSTSSSYGYSPFYRNTSLRTVVITDTETEIYDNEFYGCSNLKNVTIGNGVNKIGKWAFSGCSSLDYFAFGDNVQSIGEEAFSDCNNVTRILTSAMTPPVCGNQALDDINKWNCSLYVPSEAKSAYQQAEQWKEFFFIEDLPTSTK